MAREEDEEDIYTTIITAFVQIVGLAAAIIFGTFSVLSWKDAQAARIQAETANTLALAAICAQISSQVRFETYSLVTCD